MMTVPAPPQIDCASEISPILTSLLYPLGNRVVLPSFFKSLSIQGQSHFPASGPLIIAPTHRSRWDGLVVGHCMGRPATGRDLRYMVSCNEMQGLQGWLIRQFGGFAIDPDEPSVKVLRHGVELLLNHEALVIFGEGDIFQHRQVNWIKPGLARIALQAQRQLLRRSSEAPAVKILPVGLYYSDLVPRRGSWVEVRIGAPMSMDHYLQRPMKDAAQAITQDLKSRLNQLMLRSRRAPLPEISAQAG
ncbi:lysophospholipid acyltransferase family protein [Lyngbya confervoides]|uniref:1-acyl-sn-glycerol-3-phosphate acyltransferase n=1 Tax=Lyngbya confervoides BDU141951 TaxID=1574623 RepID=A0ABD4T2L3_9CYAN|nr:lysophospholipid acyltransferase family protein [Lyngbya confervoides]MCM1982861.1 1-acyl-sn-glycerol-3-phosphate acyltransferase [Lyngbya confervoides BDU141951]